MLQNVAVLALASREAAIRRTLPDAVIVPCGTPHEITDLGAALHGSDDVARIVLLESMQAHYVMTQHCKLLILTFPLVAIMLPQGHLVGQVQTPVSIPDTKAARLTSRGEPITATGTAVSRESPTDPPPDHVIPSGRILRIALDQPLLNLSKLRPDCELDGQVRGPVYLDDRALSSTTFALLILPSPKIALCQATPTEPVPQRSQSAQTQPPAQTQSPTANLAAPQKPLPDVSSSTIDPNEKTLHQTPRIMGVLPNFTAVDSNSRLPRLSTRAKFVVAMHDSVDYSAFLLVAGLAGKGLSSKAIPTLGTGAAGFGRYYWREFTDQVSGTFFTEAIFPTLTHEDPRYYTLGKNGFFRRAGYAISRTVITKNDRGTNEFNVSEIAGNASEAALSNLYYPAAERGFGNSAKNFATQTAITAGANVLKEFWPDIRKNVFRMKDKSSPGR